jgi:hypothetical protein
MVSNGVVLHQKHRTLPICAVLFVLFGVVCQAQDVVSGNLIEAGQAYQYIGGDIPLSQLVVTIYLLGTVQKFREMLLLQVPILPQIPNPLVHGITSGIGYHTAFCCIDKYRKMR